MSLCGRRMFLSTKLYFVLFGSQTMQTIMCVPKSTLSLYLSSKSSCTQYRSKWLQQTISVNWCNSYTRVLYKYQRHILLCVPHELGLLELIRLKKEIYHIKCSAGLLNKWNESCLLTTGTLWRALNVFVWLGQYQSQGTLSKSSSIIWGVLKQTPLDD